MLTIIKLPLLCFILVVLHGCASIEYYEFLEPQRSANQQFIGTPYVYSGLLEIGQKSNHYQFSGVLYDRDDKYLDITIPTSVLASAPINISRLDHARASTLQQSERHNKTVELSNSHEKQLTEKQLIEKPALLVVNPSYPFNLDVIKAQPLDFFQQYYWQYQPENPIGVLSQPAIEDIRCPDILLLNIDVYEELPTTLELGYCKTEGDNSSYTWQSVTSENIANNVEHDKMFGHQVSYLGFLLTVPFDIIAAPFYTLGWGLIASKNLLFSGEE